MDGTSTAAEQEVQIHKIHELLKAKDDTSRFVGLALLKSILDNSPSLREDATATTSLWESISPKFLDRLLKTGSGSREPQKKDMLDLVVAVLHTFVILLPESSKQDAKLVGRLPHLVAALVQSVEPTTTLILQTITGIVSAPEGAKAFTKIQDLSPLTEIAPSSSLVLDVLLFAWLNSAESVEGWSEIKTGVDKTIHALILSFKGTDGVTLLSFLDKLLRGLDEKGLSPNPTWVESVVGFIRRLVKSRPNAAARDAYTNLSNTLLQAYPLQTPQILFTDDSKSEKPFSYLFINLLLVDLRSSFPTLLAKLNNPEYAQTSRRLASAFDVISHFIGFLIKSMGDTEDDDQISLVIPSADLLLKLRKDIAETMSSTIEYLRDRWDASFAGAMGLHPDARPATVSTATGSHLTLAWDSKKDAVGDDPLILAAIRCLAIWLREDDNEMLRKEAAGLVDMLLDLYRSSPSPQGVDFRRPVLTALEGITTSEDGLEALLSHDGWKVLTEDLLGILQASTKVGDANAAQRGVEIVRLLMPITEAEQSREEWMAAVTAVAAWAVPDEIHPSVIEFQVAVLQLISSLVDNTHPGMQRRYLHSVDAVAGVARQLRGMIETGSNLPKPDAEGIKDSLDDVLGTMQSISRNGRG